MRTLTVALAVVASLGASAALAAPQYQVTGHIAGPDGGWDLLAVDAQAHRLYVARTDAVMAADLATGQVDGKLVPLQHGHGVAVIPGTGRVIATSGDANAAVLFEGATGKIIATIATAKKPDAVVYDPATKTVWVMCPGDGAATVIDPMSGKVLATVAIGGSLELGAPDGHGRLYVNVEDKNDVAVVDTRARKLVRRFPLKGCDGPSGIIYAPQTRQTVSACGNGVAIVADAATGRAVANLKIGPRPDGAVYDEARRLALIPSGGDGTLAAITLGARPAVATTVHTARGARTAAIDAATGAVYLPSAQYGAPNAQGRPSMTPGSFAVLVVSPKESH